MDGTGDKRLVSCDEIEGGVRVVLDDGETLELAADSLPPALPVPGEVVVAEILAELRDAAWRKRAARRIFRMLDRRLSTRRSIERKLAEKGYPSGPVRDVLDRFEAAGLHSDRRYAEAWCRDTLLSRPVGRRFLVDRLCGKGVARGVAEAVAAEVLDAETEWENALKAAHTWWRKQSGGADLRNLSRGQRFLAGRGFPPAVSGRAVREAAPAQGEEESF